MFPSSVIIQPDFDTKPNLLWKYKTNGPIVGSPVIDNETVFVGSLDSSLYSLNLLTGALKWKLPTNGSIRSSVCATKAALLLLSTDGLLYRIEKDSGKVSGYFKTMNGIMGDPQSDYADYFTSTPVMVDSTIYFGSGDAVYAVSFIDGYLRWSFKTGGAVHTTPAINRNLLVAGSFDGYIYAIDVKTGLLVWKFKTTGNFSFPKGEVMGNPVVASDMVFAGARDYNFYAVDVRGGFANWIKQMKMGWALPATVNDTVIYVGSSDDRTLFAFNIRTGKEEWKSDVGFNVMGGCSIGDSMGYFGTLSGKVIAINLRKGKIVWTIESESYKLNHYTYLKPDDSYRNDMGKIVKTPADMLKMYEKLGGIFGKPAKSGDYMVVAGYDGWIYCYSRIAPPVKSTK
jgi:outer membrane protein assembly factor BamB